MDIEQFREYCLSLKGVHEKMPFTDVSDRYSRDILCFYIGDRWFCFVNVEVFDFCCLKCAPDDSLELQARYMGIRPGWHMNKKHWISVYFDNDVPDDKIRELVRDSYRIVLRSLSAKERNKIQSDI
ncbi:MmcQ/YjbR family DNA-binding protein [Alistipes indistinctus]|uniref:MmcQ/YjbR family DNA-binding protein n=1 Tax=Alistipes indistinctus TaxID=626932 RepID=UPI0015F1CB49|nr:MmcQ/YjbR family DNA-binding protein [Alistipes indistinctus]BCG54275.1 hypothetical protein AI2BBH_13210 [Alistipes indistinctus]